MESSKKKRNSVLPIIVSVGIATSMGVVANSTPEVAYASSNAATSASASTSTSTATYTDRSSSEDAKNQVITFKDSVLKSKLLAVMKEQNIIANDAKDIKIADAENLTRANLRNWSVDSLDDSNTIHNLTGLEHFRGLVYLNFSGNQVSDLTPLENLTSLKTLYFSGNQVSDLTPLNNLFLKSLDFSKNKVSDLSPLGVWIA
ncbi:leucine-rich repeat domain-containing protein [Fannyhessea vaginae]|uniref:leucine-rich repeat domain-containing protein n=1 Tax=Fannyhessea vaginae TaxID=82135 RepID=UPI003A804D03